MEVSLKREKLLRSRRFITPCRRLALWIGQASFSKIGRVLITS